MNRIKMSCCSANNKLQCPIKMSDGRAFTDYRPKCNINADLFEELTKNKIIQSSYESRFYLQNNSEKIIQNDYDKFLKNLAPCAPCTRNINEVGTMHPERYVVKCDGVSCVRTEVNANGLGDGRSY
jgi:hypothetical protein